MMVGSISGNNGINQALPSGSTEATQKEEKVSQGHSHSNSLSVHHAALPKHLSSALQGVPSLPPAASVSMPTEIQRDLKLKAATGSIRAELQTGLEDLAQIQEGKVPESLVYAVAHLDLELGAIKSIPEDKLQGLRETTGKLSQAAQEGSLTTGKLEEILSELKTQLEDTSIKSAEQDIESRIEEVGKNVKKRIELMSLALNIKKALQRFPRKGFAGYSHFIRNARHLLRSAVPGITHGEERRIINTILTETRHNRRADQMDIVVNAITGKSVKNNTPLHIKQRLAVADGESSTAQYFAKGLAVTNQALTNAEFKARLLKLEQLDELQEKIAEAIVRLQSGEQDAAEALLKQAGGKAHSDIDFMGQLDSVVGELFEQQQNSALQEAIIRQSNRV